MPIEKAVTLHRYKDHRCVTTHSPRDGIVLWELQERKCQQPVCKCTDVVQTSQAGWMVLILQWKMVKFAGCFNRRTTGCRFSATISVKNCGSYFIYILQKPLSCPSRYCSKNWIWSKCAWRSKRTHKSLRRYMFIRFFLTGEAVNFLLYRKHY